MEFPHIDPVFFRLGPLEFRWYGLMYILGFTAAYYLVRRRSTNSGLTLNQEEISDLIFTLALGVILGGRLGYVIFYNSSFYMAHPLKIFSVWEGGMSFHGGLSGVILAGLYFARKTGVAFFRLADVVVQAAPVGLGLGRVGNFINGELYGRTTNLPWGVIFPGGGSLPRHPSQLYEAFLEGIVLFIILSVLSRKKLPVGVIFWSFVAFYGFFRSIVELFREPDAHLGLLLGFISMGQLLSLPMIALGILFGWKAFAARQDSVSKQ